MNHNWYYTNLHLLCFLVQFSESLQRMRHKVPEGGGEASGQ